MFICRCIRCKDIRADSHKIGLRCQQKDCSGQLRRRNLSSKSYPYETCSKLLFDNKFIWDCDSCGLLQKPEVVKRIDEMSEQMSFLSSKGISDENHVKSLSTMFTNLKSICAPQSLYIQRAGRSLVKAVIDTMSPPLTGALLEKCQYAFNILNYTKQPEIEMKYDLECWMEQCRRAKLVALMNPDPRESLDLLYSAKKEYQLFYPKDNSVILREIDEAIMNCTPH